MALQWIETSNPDIPLEYRNSEDKDWVGEIRVRSSRYFAAVRFEEKTITERGPFKDRADACVLVEQFAWAADWFSQYLHARTSDLRRGDKNPWD